MPQIRTPRHRILTLSGVDRHTNLEELIAILREYPWVEVGLLVSDTSTASRYWNFAEVGRVVDELWGGLLEGCPDEKVTYAAGPQIAIHVCGGAARQNLLGGGGAADLCRRLDRIQVNGAVDDDTIEQLLNMWPGTKIITQVKITDHDLQLPVVRSHVRRSYLVDASGGRGILPTRWRAPKLDVDPRQAIFTSNVGFAGGLGPMNLREQLPLIMEQAYHGWWIDMETSLRTDPGPEGRFSLGLAQLAIDCVEKTLDRALDWRFTLP